MKSTDKFVLVLVASLALLLAGCGGGSSTTAPPVDPGPTAAEQAIMDAKAALTTAQAGVSGDMMTDAQMLAAYQVIERAANNLVMVLKANNGSLADVEMATTARQDAMNMVSNLEMKIADAQAAADKAMMAMAAKLYTAIGETPLTNRAAGITTDGTNAVQVATDGSTFVPLEKDKMAMVAPLHGWTGSMHTAAPTGGGTYTAQMYANVGEPTPGPKFNSGTGDGNVGFTLDATSGAVTIPTTDTTLNAGSRIVSPQFDHTAGTKPFKLPDPNSGQATTVTIPGSYYGVAGTYSCTTTVADDACAVTKAAEGYTLAGTGTTWTFKPGDANARVTAVPDSIYAVYGWWLHEAADGTPTVSAFASVMGSVPAAADLATLNGTATYKGGAAGKYTVRAGAVNDAGHFTADAELMANFSANSVTGTIDNFMGSDGMSRDWSVALGASNVATGGAIAGDPDDSTDTGPQETTWTMGGSAASAEGSWGGTLYDNNAGGVPKVGNGTFHSTYGNIGRMVGAFGVNLEN